MKDYLANNIRILRKRMRLSQEQLGNVLGKAKPTISGYELGIRQPSMEDLRAICNYFHISEAMILNEDLSEQSVLDVEVQADWIKQELIANRMTEEEFNLLEAYIDFLMARRDKDASVQRR